MPRWAVVLAVVAALVPAAMIGAHRVLADPPPAATPRPDRPIPPVATGTSTPPPTASSPSPAPSPSASVARLPTVPADAPRRIASGNLLDAGFDDAVTTLEPASSSEVARLGSRGSPASPGTDTVYVVGRVRAGGAFETLPRLQPGNRVSIRTDSGTMTYTVESTGLQPGAALAPGSQLGARVPGRLVLVGIRYDESGDRLPEALVAVAHLSGAEKA